MGIHHRISGHLLQAYADEMAWRENNRRQPNGTHWNLITAAALAHPKSAIWAGYWHRSGGMTDHVVAALIAKRAELAGIIDQLQRQLDQHRADLAHIDGVLRVLAADLDPRRSGRNASIVVIGISPATSYRGYVSACSGPQVSR